MWDINYDCLEEQRKILAGEITHTKMVRKMIYELIQENKVLFPALTPIELELGWHIEYLEKQIDEILETVKDEDE